MPPSTGRHARLATAALVLGVSLAVLIPAHLDYARLVQLEGTSWWTFTLAPVFAAFGAGVLMASAPEPRWRPFVALVPIAIAVAGRIQRVTAEGLMVLLGVLLGWLAILAAGLYGLWAMLEAPGTLPDRVPRLAAWAAAIALVAGGFASIAAGALLGSDAGRLAFHVGTVLLHVIAASTALVHAGWNLRPALGVPP